MIYTDIEKLKLSSKFFSFAESINDIQNNLSFDIKFSMPNGNGFVIIPHGQLAEHKNSLLRTNLRTH